MPFAGYRMSGHDRGKNGSHVLIGRGDLVELDGVRFRSPHAPGGAANYSQLQDDR